MREKLFDRNIAAYHPILTPNELKRRSGVSPRGEQTVRSARQAIRDILDGQSTRKLIVVGPCSIHNPDEAKEYALKLKGLARDVDEHLLLVIRAYFEKPRTTIGWKGLINDPYLNGTFDIEAGLEQARELLVHLAEIGIPAATEALDPITFQYFSDAISWASIGARTTESQTHRELASGLSMPVGFKNNTQGNVDVAINALRSAQSSHRFFGIDQQGRNAIVTTRGNPYGHVVLRGGDKPNYDLESVIKVGKMLREAALRSKILIDCSHGNSRKDYREQPEVFRYTLTNILAGNNDLIGMMLESNLEEGSQPISKKLMKGISITDGCIGWNRTEELIREAHTKMVRGSRFEVRRNTDAH